MRARIPFGGFYESKFSAGLDDAETQHLEYLREEHDIDTAPLQEWLWRHAKYHRGYEHIAADYVPLFEEFINEGLGLSLKLTFNGMDSPKYYNFETDHIYVDISYRDALILARRVGRNALRAAAKELFTSRDGFISFYRNDPAEWGRLRGWDECQLFALFTAAVNVIGDEDYEWRLDAALHEGGTYDEAFWKSFSSSDFNIELGRVLERKEQAEAAEEDGDGRSFPAHWTSTEDYVRKYEAMNRNIFNTLTKSEGL